MTDLGRPVIDPNVLVSAAITPSGATGDIVRLIGAGTVVPVVSAQLLTELAGVLRRPRFRRYLDLDQCDRFVATFAQLAEHVDQSAEPPGITRDSADDYLVALARAAGADVLVSGDRDLTDLALDDVATLTPRQFLDAVLGDPAVDLSD